MTKRLQLMKLNLRLLISYYEFEKYIYKTKFQLEKFHTQWEFLHGLFTQ